MTKAKKILLAVVPVFVVLAVEAGIALWAFRPVQIAVSYTHLDVYKRQQVHWSGMINR